MKRTVLLASRNPELQTTRSLVLEKHGYRTIQVTDLESALKMAHRIRPEILILGHTFQPEEQRVLVEQVHETMPDLLVICLRTGILQPELLLSACAAASDGHPGSQRVRVLGEENGFHVNGFHRDGFRADGVHANGFHADGVRPDGFHADGLHTDGVRADGLKKLKVDSE